MFKDEFAAVAQAAVSKRDFLKNKPVAYFVSSMLAGMFIAFGVFICFTMGSVFQGEAAQKLVMGITFSVALSLVVIAGAELFTGNNLVMTAGALNGTVGWGSVIKLFVVCYIGNWIGSVIAALLNNFAEIEAVQHALAGIRVAVVVLVGFSVWKLMKSGV